MGLLPSVGLRLPWAGWELGKGSRILDRSVVRQQQNFAPNPRGLEILFLKWELHARRLTLGAGPDGDRGAGCAVRTVFTSHCQISYNMRVGRDLHGPAKR